MTRPHLYLFGLWLPVLVLAIISVGEAILKNFWWHEMSRATGYFLLGGMMGGIQYLLFAAAVTWRFHRMETQFLSRISWVMPIMFFPVCFVGLFCFFQLAEVLANKDNYYTDQAQQQGILGASVRLGTITVACTYVYVACIHALGFLLEKCGLMRDEE